MTRKSCGIISSNLGHVTIKEWCVTDPGSNPGRNNSVKMNYLEAQNKSPIGVAVWGNYAMKDIVWPKDEPHPYIWITKNYKPCSLNRTNQLKNSDDWEPVEEKDWFMEK